jgi:hypothetical protein
MATYDTWGGSWSTSWDLSWTRDVAAPPTFDAAIDDEIEEGIGKVSYTHYEAVVPSDTVDLTFPCQALYIGGAGVVRLVREDNTVVSFTVPAGKTLTGKFRRVNATSTTATLMVAMR